MFRKFLEHFKKIDWVLVMVPIFLSLFGIVTQYSLSGRNNPVFLNDFTKQIIFVSVGLVLMFAVSFYEYRNLIRQSGYFYVLIIILLATVLIVGSITNGARSWFDIGPFKFQPVELLKIFSILLLSFFWSNHNKKKNTIRDFFNSFLIFIPALFLVLLQPDFGGFILVFACIVFYMLLVNIKFKYILTIFLSIVAIFSLFWLFVFKDYQKDRIVSFLNPLSDPAGRGYQVKQSMIAIGSGGVFGKGFGFGDQSKLKFLPESSNDFVFATFSEEFGFVGSAFIIGLFFILFYRMYYFASGFDDNISSFVVLGYMILLLMHFVINIGMNIGIMPVTGISLPFVSYGGSGIIVNFIIFGIIQNIIISQKKF